jgi:hypothetical protein
MVLQNMGLCGKIDVFKTAMALHQAKRSIAIAKYIDTIEKRLFDEKMIEQLEPDQLVQALRLFANMQAQSFSYVENLDVHADGSAKDKKVLSDTVDVSERKNVRDFVSNIIKLGKKNPPIEGLDDTGLEETE